MNKANIFFQLTKVDLEKRTVEGIATAEIPDKSGEVCDYETTKPFYQKWSDGIKKASGGKSLGNVRAMHSNIAAGKIVELIFDDVKKAINIVAKIVDDAEWNKVVEGVYTGFSQGGEYIKRWKDGELTRYTADPSEVSIVDNPCLGVATFAVVKADGIVEERSFKKINTETKTEVRQVWLAKDGSTHDKKELALKKNIEIDAEASAKAAIAATQQSIDAANSALSKKEKEGEEDENENEDDVDKCNNGKKEADAGDIEKKKAEDKEACSKSIETIKKYEGQEVWDAAAAIDALCAVQNLLSVEQWEAMEGEDEAAQIAMLRVAIGKLKEFIASELAEDNLEPDMTAKAAKDEMAKAYDEKLEKADAINKSLTKALEDVNGQVAALVKRIDTLEKLPAPKKGALFAVERGQEISHESSGGTVEAVPDLTKLRLSPEEMRKLSPFGL